MYEYKDSTLQRFTKNQLIELIKGLQQECINLHEMNDNQFRILMTLDMSLNNNIKKVGL